MNRDAMLQRATAPGETWDIVVVGGGATGAGVAVDAASRGYKTLLLERADFGKGTSSRSTKLVHGGVRYLEQGNVSLVMEALKERGMLRRNAPHLVSDLAFVVPNYSWWEAPFYGIGLKLYDLLAGRYGFGPSMVLTRGETLARLPNLKVEGLRGGVVYFDGQFDDARLLIHLIATAVEQGATCLSYAPVTALARDADGYVNGVVARDLESGAEIRAHARVVVNATGAFSDGVRRMADPGAEAMIAPSQGVHLVFDGSFLASEAAILVPHTRDGRVLFAIPWHGHALVGTTDTPIEEPTLEPAAREDEIDFILETAGKYLQRPPTRRDVLSVFAGIRPLVKSGGAKSTAAISRDHTIHIDASGLVTVAGGKWTTYRRMAEDCVDHASTIGHLPERECVTRTLAIHGACSDAARHGPRSVYGSDAPSLDALDRGDLALAAPLDDAFPFTGAEVTWAAREEMARTVEDVLARRTRALFLDARAATAAAPRVAVILAKELGRDGAWVDAQLRAFRELAARYQVKH